MLYNRYNNHFYGFVEYNTCTIMPAKGDSDVVFVYNCSGKILIYSFHLSLCESIDHSCINPFLRIGLIHK